MCTKPVERKPLTSVELVLVEWLPCQPLVVLLGTKDKSAKVSGIPLGGAKSSGQVHLSITFINYWGEPCNC